MEIRLVRAFVTIAEKMSFTEAADSLHITQSALTQQLATLEAELRVELIDRSNRRRMKLTGPGQVLLAEGRKLIAAEQEAIEATRSAQRGVGILNIGHMGSATSPFIGNLSREFLALHPGTEFRFHDLSPEEQDRRMERNEIDLGFAREAATSRNFTLNSLVIYQDRLQLAIPTSGSFGQSNRIADYRDIPLIVYDRVKAPWLFQTVEGFLYRNGIAPRLAGVAQGMVPMLLSVASAQAYALVPGCLRYLCVPGVEFRTLNEATPPLNVSVVWRSDNRSQILQEFIAFLAERKAEIQNLFS